MLRLFRTVTKMFKGAILKEMQNSVQTHIDERGKINGREGGL